jgi:hypothetical protein
VHTTLDINLFLNAKAFWPFVESGLSTIWSCKKYLLTIAVCNSWKRYFPINIGLKYINKMKNKNKYKNQANKQKKLHKIIK